MTQMYFTDYIVHSLMQFFANQRDYTFSDAYKFIFVKNVGKDIGRHYTRVEDTIYVGEREGWKHHNFNYSDISTVSNFIKNNKEKLIKYYSPFKTTATDTHIYTRMQ